jgi:hypothetical protein
MTSHLSQSNVTVHPALHNGLMPIRDATVRWGTICSVKMYGNPEMVMPHICGDFIFLPSGMFNAQGLAGAMVIYDISAFHNKNGCSLSVSHGLVGSNCNRIQILLHRITK